MTTVFCDDCSLPIRPNDTVHTEADAPEVDNEPYVRHAECPEPVIDFRRDDFRAQVYARAADPDDVNGPHLLRWTDYVANDWVETFDDLSAAIARLALLQRCAEADWTVGFAHNTPGSAGEDADLFAIAAKAFFESELT